MIISFKEGNVKKWECQKGCVSRTGIEVEVLLTRGLGLIFYMLLGIEEWSNNGTG